MAALFVQSVFDEEFHWFCILIGQGQLDPVFHSFPIIKTPGN
jgi:hypothetical protein